jgi:hypothetical protein
VFPDCNPYPPFLCFWNAVAQNHSIKIVIFTGSDDPGYIRTGDDLKSVALQNLPSQIAKNRVGEDVKYLMGGTHLAFSERLMVIHLSIRFVAELEQSKKLRDDEQLLRALISMIFQSINLLGDGEPAQIRSGSYRAREPVVRSHDYAYHLTRPKCCAGRRANGTAAGLSHDLPVAVPQFTKLLPRTTNSLDSLYCALPDRLTACGLFPASPLTLSTPVNVPLVSGWKVTVSVQRVNAATLVPQPVTE